MSDSILNSGNKYGYQININHPKILPLYEKFKQKNKIIIPSDAERLEFEEIIFKMIRRNNSDK